jgi:cell division septation protein DedD
MRFEIRTGGAILILIGLMGLSGAVFALGLVAGYVMERQNTPDISQVASTFPAPSPPANQPTATASPAAVSAASPAPLAASTAGNLAKPVLSSKAAKAPATPKAMAARTTPSVRPEPVEGAASIEKPIARPSPRAAATVASAPPEAAAAPRKKGYNIQIEAVMDHSGAEDMIRKLRALGYTPYEVPTQIGGQTWYRVRVGPYATPEEARAAQDKLKEQYKAAYMSR